MTTIAYRDGIVACDSRITCDGMIFTDSAKKMQRADGAMFFIAGSAGDCDAFIEAYFSDDRISGDLEVNAIIIDDGSILVAGVHDGRIWVNEIKYDEYIAIGSGQDYAIAAMDMGADARTAVKQAIKRDVFSGGRVRVYRCL